ncbi:MAG: hypothetical protein M3178_01390 [Pseudomonadota bacterium]|nr:hypothetical protein [Pseudomonadota bacterium]
MALRVLPVVQTAKGYKGRLVLPVFRATAVSWSTAKYPTHETELAAAAAVAYVAAVVAAADVAVAAATADAAAARAASGVGSALITVTAAALAAAAAVRTADAYAAVAATRAAAAATRAAATRAGDAYACVGAFRAAAYGAAFAEDAAHAAIYADARAYAVAAASAHAAATASAAGYASDAAIRYFWSALTTDATGVEKGKTTYDIAGSPLWPHGQPDELRSLWRELAAGLLGAKQDWRVWTTWYDDRLDGRFRGEERELGYVRIEEYLWEQSPAIVNAEIKRRVDKRAPPALAGSSYGFPHAPSANPGSDPKGWPKPPNATPSNATGKPARPTVSRPKPSRTETAARPPSTKRSKP